MSKILFKTAQEHWDWAYDNYLRFKTEDDNNLWGEHEKALEPFFKWDNKRSKQGIDNYPKMTKEEKESFNLYKKIAILPQYSPANETVASRFDTPELVDTLGFIYDESEEIDDYYVPVKKDKPFKTREDISYPCILLTWMEISYDRCSGDNVIAINRFVSLAEFN